MDCPSCGVAVREGARFCGACGGAVPATETVGPQKGPSLPPLSPSAPPITVTQDVGPAPPGSAPPPPGAPAPRPASSNTPWVIAAVAAVVVAVAVVAMVVAFAGNDESAGGPSPADPQSTGADGASESDVTTPTSSTSTTSSTTSTTLDPEAAALQELQDRVEQDEATFQARGLEDAFVPQLSAKQLGTSADGIVYSHADIVAHIEDLESAYGEVLVLNSSDYTSFETPGFFVMMVPESSSTGEGALDWCFDHGLTDKDDCFAKVVSRTQVSSDFTTMLPDEL